MRKDKEQNIPTFCFEMTFPFLFKSIYCIICKEYRQEKTKLELSKYMSHICKKGLRKSYQPSCCFLPLYSSFLFSISWLIYILSKETWSIDSLFASIEVNNLIEQNVMPTDSLNWTPSESELEDSLWQISALLLRLWCRVPSHNLLANSMKALICLLDHVLLSSIYLSEWWWI